MSLASKLQIKPGQQVVVLRKPAELQLDVESSDKPEDAASADAALAFVTVAGDLSTAEVEAVLAAARRDAVAWLAYPKGGGSAPT